MMAAAYRLKSTLNGARRFGRGVALVGLLALTVDPALAQSDAQIPGLIVSVPSAETSPAAQSPSPGPGVNPLLRGTATGVQQAPPSRAKQRPVKKQRRPAKKVAKRSQPKAQRAPRRKHGVAVLVNDEPITHHEIDQRARLMMVQANVNKTARAKFQSLIKQKSVNNQLRSLLKETIDANPGKSREQILAKFERKKKAFAASLRARALSSARSGLLPQFRKKAKKQLIEERLKMQEAKRLKTLASWKDVDGAIANIAKRNKVDVKTFLGRLGTGGARSTTFKNKIRADMSWSGVVRRRYGHTIAVSLADIDRHANTASGESATKLKLHQIVVPLPKKIDQSAVAARLRDAETLQASFRGCATTQKVAKRISGAVFKDLGAVKPDTIPEPTRSLLLQAKDGEISPPTITSKGVVLYAVCSRTSGGSVKDTARTKARQALRQREFEIMGRRHLADLQRDAHIEYR